MSARRLITGHEDPREPIGHHPAGDSHGQQIGSQRKRMVYPRVAIVGFCLGLDSTQALLDEPLGDSDVSHAAPSA